MQLIDSVTTPTATGVRTVELHRGDLTRIQPDEAVDVLVVSAFPDDYVPTRGSLIGALDRAGLSVEQLASRRAVDLREFSSCWISEPIDVSRWGFARVLCFEPSFYGEAPQVVGDVFRSLFPFTAGPQGVRTVAMPLLASGDQGESPSVMLEALMTAGVLWQNTGMPLDRLKIVVRDGALTEDLVATFRRVAKQLSPQQSAPLASESGFDVFVSYSHADRSQAMNFVNALHGSFPKARVFVDSLNLNPGAAWQSTIFEAIDRSRAVVCLYSPEYVTSAVCKEEFNISLARQREGDTILFPVFLRSAKLPTYMRMIQFVDVREDDTVKVHAAAAQLASRLATASQS